MCLRILMIRPLWPFFKSFFQTGKKLSKIVILVDKKLFHSTSKYNLDNFKSPIFSKFKIFVSDFHHLNPTKNKIWTF